jgi:hypothetical protein
MRYIYPLFLPLFLWAQSATLKTIVDTDTLIFTQKDDYIICQLAFIDAPESKINSRALDQAKECSVPIEEIIHAGKTANDFMSKSIKAGKEYEIDIISPIKNHWTHCIVHIPQGTHPQLHPTLNGVLLDQGYGVFHKTLLSHKEAKQMQERANLSQKELRGLWKKFPKIMKCLKAYNQ